MPHRLVWLPTQEVLQNVPCTCIDGRTSGMRYSAAGGSIGIIIHVLNQLEARQNTSLSNEAIQGLLVHFASTISPVYLHTDQHTLDLIYARLGLDSNTKLKSLTETQQRSFIELATQTDFQGCGHIKLLMQLPHDYDVNKEVVEKVLKQFFILFFKNTPNVLFDVLAGQHEEEHVVIVEEQHEQPVGETTALSLEDKQDGHQFFCHRPLKKELITQFTQLLDDQLSVDYDEDLIASLTESHNRSAEKTLAHLAGSLGIEKIRI
jgi:hypothetical protein